MPFRAFVAVPVTATPALVDLLRAIEGTGADVRCPTPDHLHLTISFLGTVPDAAAEPLGEAIARAAQGQAPFEVELHGAGAFPNVHRPRVVWAGMRNAAPLLALAERVRAELARVGHPGDDKPFKAHVTLGRVKSDRGLGPLVELVRARKDAPLGAMSVEDVRLYKSTLTPKGSVYEVVARSPLPGGAA